MGFMKKLYTEIEIEVEAALDSLGITPETGCPTFGDYDECRAMLIDRLTQFVEQQFIQSDAADWHPAFAAYRAVLGAWHPKGRAALLRVWADHLSTSRNYLQGVVTWLRDVAEALDSQADK